ncbi:MAG: tetratricopeptide repeat protein [Candidatus Zixiibacteriota bacterium]
MFRRIALVVFLLFTVLAVVVALKDDKEVTTSSREAYEHYLAGIEWKDNFYFRQAMEEFEQAIKLDSNFAMAQAELADVYSARGFTKKAKEMQATALAQREHVSNREQLRIDIKKAQWDSRRDEAYELSQEYLKRFPEDIDAITGMALQEFGRENYEESLRLFQAALKQDPKYAMGYNMLGYLNYYLGRYDEALAMLDKYIDLSREQANPHDSRGEILHAVGRYDEAIAEFRQAFNINPDFDFATLHTAQTYQALGQNRQTDYCFQVLFNQAPSEAKMLQYYNSWAGLMIYREEYDSARTLLAMSISRDPNNEMFALADAYRLLGTMCYREQNLDSMRVVWNLAREVIKKTLAEKPQLSSLRGFQQYQRTMDATEADLEGRSEDALRLFSEAVNSATTPEEKLGYRVYYADVLRRSGQLDLAISELQKNLSINPNHGRTLARLADVYEAAGDLNAALAYRERAAEVWKNADPEFALVRELKSKLESSLASSARTPVTPAGTPSIN